MRKNISDRIYRIFRINYFVAFDSFRMKLPKRNPDFVGRKAVTSSELLALARQGLLLRAFAPA
jgi:hypothetical protein